MELPAMELTLDGGEVLPQIEQGKRQSPSALFHVQHLLARAGLLDPVQVLGLERGGEAGDLAPGQGG